MKRIIFLLSLMTGSMAAFAQGNDGFTLAKTSDNVDCYYSLTTCNGKSVVLLRFDNRNASAVTVTWKESFRTAQVPKSMPGFRDKQVRLEPGVSAPQGCEDMSRKEFVIGEADVNLTYRADITGFEFADVSIKPAY